MRDDEDGNIDGVQPIPPNLYVIQKQSGLGNNRGLIKVQISSSRVFSPETTSQKCFTRAYPRRAVGTGQEYLSNQRGDGLSGPGVAANTVKAK